MTTAGAYLPWEGEVTTITKISKPNSPFHEARHQLGPAQEMMQNTLSITDKFASSGGPSSGDDGGWYQSGEHEWEVTAYDPFPSDIDQRLDPSNAGDFVSVSFDSSADARKALESVLKGDCATKLNALLGALKPAVEGKSNPLRTSDFMSLFDNIVSQAKGGLFTQQSLQEANAKYLELYPNGTPEAGGGGVSFVEWMGQNRAGVAIPSDSGSYMYVYVFPRYLSTRDDRGRAKPASILRKEIGRSRKALTAILIHEMAHGAGRNSTFSHKEMDKAAKTVDRDTRSFGDFVLKHCGVGFEGQMP